MKEAWEDMNAALMREDNYVEAYWHRHLLFLVQGKPHAALEDLTTLIKLNKNHTGAYRSRFLIPQCLFFHHVFSNWRLFRGDIYRSLGDSAMAVINYSQAIKLDDSDHMAFYNRAETYRDVMSLNITKDFTGKN